VPHIKKPDDDNGMLDPDARFLLANERTLLAWVRTSLTVIAGGIAFMHFNESTNAVTTVGVAVVALGALMSVVAFQRYKDADKAIREGELPGIGKGPAVQVIGVVLFAVALVVIELAKV
jgi:putative membrane protein